MKYGTDARKLERVLKGEKGEKGWERVVFNFPHVGGKSTDVNRQVRYNQGTFFLPSFLNFQSYLPNFTDNKGYDRATSILLRKCNSPSESHRTRSEYNHLTLRRLTLFSLEYSRLG